MKFKFTPEEAQIDSSYHIKLVLADLNSSGPKSKDYNFDVLIKDIHSDLENYKHDNDVESDAPI